MGWILPELSLALSLPLLLIISMLLKPRAAAVLVPLALFLSISFSLYLVWDQSLYLTGALQKTWFLNMIRVDGLSVIFRLLAGLSALLALGIALMSPPEKGWKTEFWLFLGTALLGLNLLCLSTNLLMVYLALEMVSLSAYLMTGYLRQDSRSAEASIKYFIYGSVASAMFLYGGSVLYGLSGTLDFSNPEFARQLSAQSSPYAVSLALIMVWCGFAFKLAAFPLHFWNPDVYEGAPASVASFFATGPKIITFAVLMRLLPAFENTDLLISPLHLLALTAILSMFAGNTAALAQNNLHRLLAWSGIAHTGYLLAVLSCNTAEAHSALIWYSLIYIFANSGAFMVAAILKDRTGTVDLRELKGSGSQMLWPALVLMLSLATLGGLPPTAGFFAKLNIFLPLLNAWNTSSNLVFMLLLIALLINTIIALYYYVRPAAWLFLKAPDKNRYIYISPVQKFMLLIPVIAVLLGGMAKMGGMVEWIGKVMEW